MRLRDHKKNLLDDVPNDHYVQIKNGVLLATSESDNFERIEGDEVWYKDRSGKWMKFWFGYKIADDGSHFDTRFG